jgi:hypothetical protein
VNLEYIVMRLIRRGLPNPVARFLASRELIIKPGIETLYPDQAVERYSGELALHDRSIRDSKLLIFGYGGSFATAVQLLKGGAEHVFLCDKYARLDTRRNTSLLSAEDEYVYRSGREVLPNPRHITLIEGDVRDCVKSLAAAEIDAVLSLHVLEHVRDVDDTVLALAQVIHPDGIHVHIIGIMDHFFKYPFQMLCYSQLAWERFLNPGSNLNRLRLPDYDFIFRKHFSEVTCRITESDLEGFSKVRHKIRPEFITGSEAVDSATEIAIVAKAPIRTTTCTR